MAVAVAGLRPRVIEDETRAALRAYLDFRRRVRHLYFFDLAWSDVERLAPDLASLWPALRGEIDRFLAAPDRTAGV